MYVVRGRGKQPLAGAGCLWDCDLVGKLIPFKLFLMVQTHLCNGKYEQKFLQCARDCASWELEDSPMKNPNRVFGPLEKQPLKVNSCMITVVGAVVGVMMRCSIWGKVPRWKYALKDVTEIWYTGTQRANRTMEGDGDREAGTSGILQVLLIMLTIQDFVLSLFFHAILYRYESHTSQQRPMHTRLKNLWLWDITWVGHWTAEELVVWWKASPKWITLLICMSV